MKWKLGTRGSNLAIAQSMQVKNLLEQAYADLEIEICIIQTKGDKMLDVALDQLNDKGVFVKEIEQALLAGEIDLAIHSMKDMPSIIDNRLCFTKTLLREDARDVLILKDAPCLKELKQHAKIATGSKRRALQLVSLRDDIEICGIRGNIETRIRKMEEEGLDGIVLAAAGLHRLHLEDKITMYFEEEIMVPACGQGALAIETRKEHVDVLQRINALCDEQIDQEVQIERSLLAQMEAGCHTPIAIRAHIINENVKLLTMYGKEDTTDFIKATYSCEVENVHRLLPYIVKELKEEVEGNKS